MKHSNKTIGVFLLLTAALFAASCAKQTAQTPTEAYKNLYAAVKAKDTEKIKQSVSKETQGLAQMMADRYKQTIEKSYENGFTITTAAAALPQMRDERIKDNFGALEVHDDKNNTWEDLPFVYEDGSWKLAFGDVMKGSYQSPAKSKAQIENEASNTALLPPSANSTTNLPDLPKGKNSMTFPAANDNKAGAGNTKSNEPKSVEVPKEEKPKK